MLGKKLINAGPVATSGANTFASENFNTVLYTGNGSTQRIGGYINRGGVFNGSSSYIQSTSLGSSFAGNNTLSISLWFRTTTNASLLSLATFSATADASTELSLNVRSDHTGDSVGFFNRNNGTSIVVCEVSGGASVIDGDWHHVVLTADTNGTKLYLDGSELTSRTFTTGNASTQIVMPSDINSFNIGANIDSGGAQYFHNGTIDQVRIFNKALSSSEVTTLYGETHASTTISTTDIFDDNSGVALYQLDGNANDTGGVSGKYGSAAIFNNNTSRSAINVSINLAGVKSISHWVKLDEFQVDNIHIFSSSSNNLQLGILNLSGQRAFFYYDGSTTNQFGASYPNDNDWHHLVWVLNGTSAELYLDGSSIGTATTASTTQTSIVIGTNSASSGVRGKLDDIRIYSDVLTSTEVGYIYNNTTASIPTDNLLAYYKLDGDARDEQQQYDGVATNVTYAYDGTATNVTYQEATKFQPDFIWIKDRTDGNLGNRLYDSVRGVHKHLNSENTAVEATNTAGLTSFDEGGFSVGSYVVVNKNNVDFVAWCFKGGGTAVSNTDGNITSSVSANQDAGFSIVEYTSTGTNGSTIGHGLSSAPDLVIIKSTTHATNWIVYNSASGTGKYMYLNSTSGDQTASWFGTSSTTFTLNNTFSDANTSGRDYISYCFHSVDGYSKIGSYTGNFSASGPIVETGFEPQFVMIKRADVAGNWFIFDNERSATNERDDFLHPNSSAAETTNSAAYSVDFLSNGFQIKGNGDQINGNNGTHIYLAIAADPDTTTPTVENSFDVVTYTGTGSTLSIETDFKPDLIWQKSRSVANHHVLTDSVRGIHSQIFSQTTDAASTSTIRVQSFDEGGFTIGNDSRTNTSGVDYVAWCWKAGDHDDNLPQINTEGSIDSVVSVNAEAGFSIVKGKAISNGAFTVGHGLSQAPEFYVIKNTSGVGGWIVYTATTGAGQYLVLNDSAAAASSTLFWNNTAPSSTVFTMNAGQVITGGADFIAYCFHSVSGYQKIGSYTGNGGTLSVTTGFAPRFVMLKPSSLADNWMIYDTSRGKDIVLFPNLSNADTTYTGRFSFLSNGFQLSTSNSGWNGNGSTYIYLAIK